MDRFTAYEVLKDIDLKYIKPQKEIHCDESVFGFDVLMGEDPLLKKDKMNYQVMCRGITNGGNLALMELIEDNEDGKPICAKFLKRFEVEPSNPLGITRIGDLVTAIYVPDDVIQFTFMSGNHSEQINCGPQEDDLDIFELLYQESSTLEEVGSVEFRTVIKRELEVERNQDIKSKWKVTADNKVEICGKMYKRMELFKPFIPLVCLNDQCLLHFYDACSILIEYAMIDLALRDYVIRSDIEAMKNILNGTISASNWDPINVHRRSDEPLYIKSLNISCKWWKIMHGYMIPVRSTNSPIDTVFDKRVAELLKLY